VLTFRLTLIFHEDDGRIDPWWWELASCGHEAKRHFEDKAAEAAQAGNLGLRVLAICIVRLESVFDRRNLKRSSTVLVLDTSMVNDSH
jgi:hypothetical protein